MKIRLLILATSILLMAGCGQTAKEVSAPAAKLKPTLLALSPAFTVAGEKFNVQPDGSSALGASVKNASSTAVIVFGTRVLETVHGPGALSTTVPPELFAKPGATPVFVRDVDGDSNSIDFVVKPPAK